MPILPNYNQFQGRHWETGSVRDYLAYRGVKAPHTGQPYSEALLMGVSGGAVMGYFSFAYQGYDPMCRILTRNTFDPLNTLLSRLGIVQHVQHTSIPEKAVDNLLDVLEAGTPAIVWADHFSLPYNVQIQDEGMWGMLPILVYGFDLTSDTVWIADRADVPLTVTTGELHKARARVKKDKFRVLTLDPPNPDKLVSAVQAGIWDCIKLYTEKPPKGSKNNFGLAAFHWWAKLLTNPKARTSWEKVFPAGTEMYAGLTSAFFDINIFGKRGHAERDLYADFLDEACVLLDRPALKEPAIQFRAAADAWDALSLALLPENVPALKETRELMLVRARLFRAEGSQAQEEIVQIDNRLEAIKSELAEDFPLSPDEVTAFRANLAEQVLQVHEIEENAVNALRDAMG